MSSQAGKYRLGRLIGGGGMAEVFEATAHGAEGFARPVAIKRMLPTLSRDPGFGQMFVNEARIAALLHHENVVSVLDFDRDAEGRYFLVMELVRGVDLRHLASSGAVPMGVIAYIAGEVLQALAYAHELEHEGRPLGIVHRDVSPHNVMVSWDGAVKLVDFGIAKAVAATGASRSGGLKGKLAYMSPEQAHGVSLDGRADVFAVGVMCHELITGQRLFAGHTEAEVLARLLSQPIPWPRQTRPDVPAELEAVVMRMLERDRNARYTTAHDALEALMATPTIDARAKGQLRELMRKRFPEAPRRRGESEPGFGAPSMASSGALPIADLATVPQGRAVRELMAEQTRTSAATPVAGALEAAPPRPSRRWLGLAAVIGAAVAVAVVAVVVSRGASTKAVSGDEAAAGVDAAAVAEPAGKAAPVAEAALSADVAGDASVAEAPQADAADKIVDDGEATGDRRRGRDGAAEPVRAPSKGPPTPAAAPVVATDPGAAARTGTLSVKVSPWAQIYVDGKRTGDTPALLTLPAGDHQIQVINNELGKSETRAIVIRPGQTEEIRLRWGD